MVSIRRVSSALSMIIILANGVLLAQAPRKNQRLPSLTSDNSSHPQNEIIAYEHTTVQGAVCGSDTDVNGHRVGIPVGLDAPSTRQPEDRPVYPLRDIYSVRPDGTNLKALTTNGNSVLPNWSPDGQRILFAVTGAYDCLQIDLPFGLYVMNRDGSSVHLIRGFGSEVRVMNHPAWSPDGKTIMVESGSEFVEQGGRGLNIYLILASGQGEAQTLVRYASLGSWSPDSKRIVFGHGPDGIQVENVDGSSVISLIKIPSAGPNWVTENPVWWPGSPAWSPDGKQIAFSTTARYALPYRFSNPARPQNEIFLMDSSGSHSRQLTIDPDWSCVNPSWSPDGKRLVFSCMSECITYSTGTPPNLSPPECANRIFVINVDAPPSKLTPLIEDDAQAPVFAPSN